MSVIEEVIEERLNQISKGFGSQHDDYYTDELVIAAICYAEASKDDSVPFDWPWSDKWWKPSSYRKNKIKAIALLIADIERHDRRFKND